MGLALCTAEKPNVAEKIAEVIGAHKKLNGYYEGNGYLVTWAVGHLVGLAEPEAYGYISQKDMYESVENRNRAFAELPLIPRDFKLIVLERTKEQFQIIKSLMQRPDVEYIIDCGDMGPEGHILQWFIRERAGNNKPVKRFCATTSLTREAIIKGMGMLRDADEFTPIIRGELCKKKADWIMGMSLSRAESIKYHAGINVGRVQSPTLYFIFKRWAEVQNFKTTDYFTLTAHMEGGFNIFWNKDKDNIFSLEVKDSEDRVTSCPAVKDKAGQIMVAGHGIVSRIQKAQKSNDRPQLFDATELQREANRRYGYAASVTLATSQTLYERDMLSYPRTDSRYLTEDIIPSLVGLVERVGTIAKYRQACQNLLSTGLNIDKKLVDNRRVTDHHGLIPVEVGNLDFNLLVPAEEERKQGVTPETMKNVLDLCLCRFIIALSKAYIFEQTNIMVTFSNGMNLTAVGKKSISMGWKDMDKILRPNVTDEIDDNGQEKQIFPELKKGQVVKVQDVEVIQKKNHTTKITYGRYPAGAYGKCRGIN